MAISSKLKIIVAVLGGLLFPGLGHLLLGKWIRALLFAFAILSLFYLGLVVEGRLHDLDLTEFITTLFFFADISNGLPYVFARNWGYGAGNAHNPSFDYGNTFLAVSGLLNLLVTLNAYDIAIGRKK
jgi:uncharacterized membrane protein YhaH (DUF805 family)